MATKLCQIVAIANGAKTRAKDDISRIHHMVSKADLTKGLTRTYRPKDENGDKMPDESTLPRVKVEEALKEAAEHWTRVIDVIATQDTANCNAKGTIVVEGLVLEDIPVTHLLFLEKHLTDVRTFIAGLPTLDPTKEWEFDSNVGYHISKAEETTKTQKVRQNHIKYEATKEHPAQVEMYTEDVVIGYYTKRDFSGAISDTRKKALLDRADNTIEAIRKAREEANTIEVRDTAIGKQLFGYLFA